MAFVMKFILHMLMDSVGFFNEIYGVFMNILWVFMEHVMKFMLHESYK